MSNIESEVAGRAKAQDQNLKVLKIQTSEPKDGKKRVTTGQLIKAGAKKQAK